MPLFLATISLAGKFDSRESSHGSGVQNAILGHFFFLDLLKKSKLEYEIHFSV